jgi:hypothetical protein
MRSKTEFDKFEYSIDTTKANGGFADARKEYDTEVLLYKGDTRVSGRVFTGGKPRGFDYVELEFLKPLK